MLTERQANAIEELEYGLFMMHQESVVLVDTPEGVFAVDSHELNHNVSWDTEDLAIIGRKLKNASVLTKRPEKQTCGYCERGFYPKGNETTCPSCHSQTYWRN